MNQQKARKVMRDFKDFLGPHIVARALGEHAANVDRDLGMHKFPSIDNVRDAIDTLIRNDERSKHEWHRLHREHAMALAACEQLDAIRNVMGAETDLVDAVRELQGYAENSKGATLHWFKLSKAMNEQYTNLQLRINVMCAAIETVILHYDRIGCYTDDEQAIHAILKTARNAADCVQVQQPQKITV